MAIAKGNRKMKLQSILPTLLVLSPMVGFYFGHSKQPEEAHITPAQIDTAPRHREPQAARPIPAGKRTWLDDLPAPQAAAVQPAKVCHGHDAGNGTWELNPSSWSDAEILEMGKLAEQLKALDPMMTDTGADIMAIVDQLQCKTEATREQAMQGLLTFAKRQAEIRNMTPEQRAAFAAQLARIAHPD
jgi:hypothetical protein